MKVSNVVAITATATTAVSALRLAPRSANPRVVGIDIERRNVPDIIAHEKLRIRKRQKTVTETLDNDESLYYANITLGTPAQSLRMHIDTGSSDLWVNVANSTLCQSSNTACIGGTYDGSSSSTHKFVNSDFNISYVDGSGAVGSYVSDTLGFGGISLDDFQFGVGDESSSQQGVLGIGYTGNEVQVQRAHGASYPNLPVALTNAGHTNRNAYSLWLNDLDASTGMILFGGVNTAKYQGDLTTVPIIKQYGGYYELVIALSGFAMSGSSVTSANLPAPVLLDSGSTLTYLPDDIVTTIYNSVNAVYNSNAGVAYAECSLANSDSTLDFTFSGQTIKVPYNELFLDAGTDARGNPLTFQNGDPACIFGIAPADGTTPVLGDTFLRSAYVVYDLDNNEISVAQTVFNATANDIQEIASGTASIPGATAAASPVSTVAAGTATANSKFSSSSSADLNSASNGAISLSAAPLMVVGAAVIAGVALLL